MAVNFFKQGSHGTDDPANLRTLWAWAQQNRYSTFFNTNTNLAYQIPSGIIFRITRVILTDANSVAVNSIAVTLATSTAPTAAFNAVPPPTAYTEFYGDSSGLTSTRSPLAGVNTGGKPLDFPVIIKLNATTPGRYLNMRSLGAISGLAVTIEGYEDIV